MPSKFIHEDKSIILNPEKWIYAYEAIGQEGYIKIGETKRKNPEQRIKEQLISSPNKQYKILGTWNALQNNKMWSDKDIHKTLKDFGFENHNEFFKIELSELSLILMQIFNDLPINPRTKRINSFKLRDEQLTAIEKTVQAYKTKGTNRFLWNAKMRFGKTFTSYKLIEKMDLKKILIITYKPSIFKSWIDDLQSHIDFEGWGYAAGSKNLHTNPAVDDYPFITFKSFQDIKQRTRDGEIKELNKILYEEEFDMVIFDEYHFGSWNSKSKSEFLDDKHIDKYMEWIGDETRIKIHAKHKLYLSGTPFKVLSNGEFSDDQIYTWSYSDEQKIKALPKNKNNVQYQSLPTMVIMTYKAPKDIEEKYLSLEGSEFNLNEFLKSENNEFVHKDDVYDFLSWISGSKSIYNRKFSPYFLHQINDYIRHSFWLLPSVSSVYAMKTMLNKHPFFKEYEIIIAADSKVKSGSKAYDEVTSKVKKYERTITLSAGMLNTGTTIKEWNAVFMLSNLSSPETYFQTAFRAQSPNAKKNNSGFTILKDKAYVFDFAPQRSLRMVYEQVDKYDKTKSKEEKIDELIDFLPILSIEGNTMQEINASSVIEYVVSGTTAALLARRWESPMLVNVTNGILKRILSDEKLLNAIMNIKGFRNLNRDFELILNKTKKVSDVKNSEKITKNEKKEISKEEKEIKSKRKEIQEKLIKFAARIPIFMYLTDDREKTLFDLIKTTESKLFYETTGLTTYDFDLLNKAGLFVEDIMNDAVWEFRRYENDSFEYLGISKRDDEKIIGGFRGYISKDNLLNETT